MTTAEDPWKAVAESINATCTEREDAPSERSGEGWEGSIGGFCPVQGQGTVDGLNWYFRARHDSWSFEVWREAFGPGGALPPGPQLWWAQAEYDQDDGDASWMRSSHAWQYIEASIATGRACGWAMPSESPDAAGQRQSPAKGET